MSAGRGNMRTRFKPDRRRNAEHRAASLVAGDAALRGTTERSGPRLARLAKEGES